MGAFLTTSLMTKFWIWESRWDSIEGNKKKKCKFIKSVFVDTDIFDMSDSDGTVYFDLKEEVLKEELIPFLKIFYGDFYGENEKCNLIIESIEKEKDVKKWLGLASDPGYQYFQRDPYGSLRLYQDGNRIGVDYEAITLAMEGKISMEMYGEHFSFFESLIKEVYSDFKLSDLIQIGIS